MLRALVERRIGRRDQAKAWIWHLAEYTRDVHEEYAVHAGRRPSGCSACSSIRLEARTRATRAV